MRTTWRTPPRSLRPLPGAEAGTPSLPVDDVDRRHRVCLALIYPGRVHSGRRSPRRMRLSARLRSDALIYIRELGCDVNDAALIRCVNWTKHGPKGLSTPDDLRLRPKEMRIPPLRSAVKMESDVSLGSSVTPDRSAIAARTELDPYNTIHDEKVSVNRSYSANLPSLEGKSTPVDPAGGHCYWSPI
jgi:hypothetical protein